MKYLKICSFAAALLLLAAPSALAEFKCALGTNLQEIRMESKTEKSEGLKVTCTWLATDVTGFTGTAPTGTGTGATKATGTKFTLEVDFNGQVAKDPTDEDQMPTLWLQDVDPNGTTTGIDNIFATGTTAGQRKPAPAGEVSGDSVLWEDIVFPTFGWDFSSDNSTGSSFTIDNLHIDASSVNNDRLKATIVLTASQGTTDVSAEDESDVARIKQALDLEFSEDNKAQKFNACEPGKKDISVNVMEGFRKAWKSGTMANDIMLMTSSGKISAKKAGILEVTKEGGDDEIIIDVSGATNAKDDSTDLKITFEPAMGGSGDITLSAMILPMRRTDEAFVKSADLVVGSFDVCKGDKLFFPFVTSRSGWDTGIVVVNNSKVDGSCSLNWGDMDLEADAMAALSTIDVDAKDHQAFLVSMQRAADYSGSVGVQCTFSSATGYVFLSDSANGIGQGYLVKP